MIICVKCGISMIMKEAGILAEEMRDREKKESYKLYSTDLMECGSCGFQVLRTSIGQSPVAEHWQDKYKEESKDCKIKFF
jgi:Zn ribbon nucleic-acid-binding protein